MLHANQVVVLDALVIPAADQQHDKQQGLQSFDAV
jgi:hypothetical protein